MLPRDVSVLGFFGSVIEENVEVRGVAQAESTSVDGELREFDERAR
jgi:hypothetical protein